MQKIIHANNRIGFLLFFFILSVIGSALIYHATTWGPWAFSDSAAYISGAKNFNLGLGVSVISAEGVFEPLNVFPPIYSLSLSAIAALGLDYLPAARILDVVLFGLLIFVFSWGLMTLTNNFWLTALSSLLVLFSPVMLNNFSGVMTEPLFITLFYTSLFFTLIYIQKQKPHLFVLAVLFTGISPFVRFIGIFTLAVNFLLILLFDKSVWKKRFGKGVLFGFFSSSPVLLWSIYASLNHHSLGTRTIIQPSDLAAKLFTFLKNTGVILQSWLPYMQYRIDLFPDPLKTAFFMIGTIILFASGMWFYRKRNRKIKISPVLQVMLASFLTILVYLMVLCVIYLFSIPQPDIISRMLSPLLPSLALLFGTVVIFFLENISSRWKTYATVLITILMVLLVRYYFLRTTAIARNLNENGYGFTAREIQTSGFLKEVQSLPAETNLIANTPAMILFHTNRMPYSVNNISNHAFGTRDSNAEQLFNTQHAALILEFAPIRNVYSDWEARLASFTHGLTISYRDEIGGIYYSPGSSKP